MSVHEYLATADGDRLDRTPTLFGCSDVDPHVPEEHIHETDAVLTALDGDVTTHIHEGMGHGVNDDELASVSRMVAALTA